MGDRKAVIFTVNHTIDDNLHPGYLPGVEKALAALSADGWLRIAIHHDPGQADVTLAYISKMLKRQLELSYVTVCGHKRGDRCLCGKPSPFLVQKAMAAMRVEPEDCVFVGSSYDDVSMGRAAGIARVHFVIPDTSGFKDIAEKEILKCFI